MHLKAMTKYQQPFLYLLLSFTLLACTQPAENPKTIADKYWQYMQTGNITEAEKLASNNSQHLLQKHSNRLDGNTQVNSGEATTIVNTTITTIDADNNRHTETFNTVLVLQQGHWKVDAEQSQIPPAPDEREKQMKQLADDLTKSMQENIDSMDNAVTQGMQILNEALYEGSEEMGNSLLQLMNELNTTMKKSIDKMKQRREQQHQEKQQQANPEKSQPAPRQGEGVI